MRPDLALKFSETGLELLRRDDAGWLSVGRADFDAAGFDVKVAGLLRRAEAAGSGPSRSKVVIPENQVRYFSVPTSAEETEAPDEGAQARAALVGATPYAAEDLVIDWVRDGATLKIAAVARETLAEAETFAARWGFMPVAFVAAPEDPAAFPREPFFGPTSLAAGLLGETPVEGDESPLPRITEDLPPPPEAATIATSPAPSKTAALAADAPPAPQVQPVSPTRPAQAPVEASVTPVATQAAEPETSEPAKTEPIGPETIGPETIDNAAPATGPADSVPAETPTPSAPYAPRVVPQPDSEKDRMTIFGAREVEKKKNRLLPMLVIAAALLLCAAGAWALLSGAPLAIFDEPEQLSTLQPEPNVSPEASDGITPEIGAPPEAPSGDLPRQTLPEARTTAPEAQSPAPETPGTLANAPAPTAPGTPPQPSVPAAPFTEPPARAAPATPVEAAARYAATGIWQRAPMPSIAPPGSTLDAPDIAVVAAVEHPPVVTGALPDPLAVPTPEAALQEPPLPPAADQSFALDDRGLVIATPDGAVSPAGHMVYLGRPDKVPPARSVPEVPEHQTDPATSADADRDPEDPAFDGPETQVAESPLGDVRPKARPNDFLPEPEAEELADAEPDADEPELAVPTIFAIRPHARPRDFETQIAAARAAAAAAEATAVAVAPTQTTTPPSPSQDSVTRVATDKRALNLKDLNLIGIMGKSSDRSALIRMPNGRILKVKVGDRLDGGRVAAISEDQLRYVKSNRNLLLEMP
ncbi:type IV pilus biogenesis protein PilP [Pseudooceanicola algae]|uniref:Uncharacterized protein n=1 Tax=Pseudooceanicola algae TaxID=1537215 RepID=A0A418SCC0_9RHOB|nr:type IV pilus biogenesis protein PilP [Pseudooceanicola algae]QPM90046.1 hypothetical protein PSAL_012790 [Pseudooceanicola algae]